MTKFHRLDSMTPYTPCPLQLDPLSWASPTKTSEDSLAMVRATMQEVFENMANRSAQIRKQGGFPRRLKDMICRELNESDGKRGQVIVELTELLFRHCRDQVFEHSGLEDYIEGMDLPGYQPVSLQRCMYLYSQVLYGNKEWGMNNIEDKRCFEIFIVFLSKVVHACIQQTLEAAIGGRTGSCQAIVAEEIGRLFRSPVFNTFNIQRARQKERAMAYAKEPKRRDSKDHNQQDALDALIKEKSHQPRRSSGQKAELPSIPLELPVEQSRLEHRREIREAVSARSPMLSSVLPSARDKIEAINQKCTSARMRSTSPRQAQVPAYDLNAASSEVRKLQNTWAFRNEKAPHRAYQHAGSYQLSEYYFT